MPASASAASIAVGHLVDVLEAVHRAQDARRAVVVDDLAERAELLGHAGADRLGAVVGALVELGAVEVADAGDVRRAEDLVVRVAGGPADPAAGHPPDQLLGRDVDEDGDARPPASRLGERVVERRGLDVGPREAVEDDAAGGVRPGRAGRAGAGR